MPEQKPHQEQSGFSQKEPASEGYKLRVSWDIPPDMSVPAATHIIVQRDGPDFIANFFELRPPLLLGNDQEKLEQLTKIDSLHAKCVARILIAAERLPDFIKAFTDAQVLPGGSILKMEEADAND